MKKKQPHKTEKKVRQHGFETHARRAPQLRQPQTETQKKVAPRLRHDNTETQSQRAQRVGHLSAETHVAFADKNQPRNDDQNCGVTQSFSVFTTDQLCAVTQSSLVFTTDQVCADLMVRCGRRRQYLQAHIRLLQQKESFRMMSIHETHRDQPGIRDLKQPWKCLVCERYRKGANRKDQIDLEIQRGNVDEQIDHGCIETQPSGVENGNDHKHTETQSASVENGNDDYGKVVTHKSDVLSENGNSHVRLETQTDPADFSHFDIAIAQMEEPRREIEKQIEQVSILLPVWKSWAEKTKGIGPLLLGQIVGECGNLLNYLSPAKIWKRMGLEPGAKRIRAVATKAGESAEERRRKAMNLGFSPRRRALMHVVGTSLMRAGGEYYLVYLDRKGYEEAQHPDWVNDKKEKKKHPSHLHKRAMRYMEKKFLKDLWVKWVEVEAILNP